MSTQCKPEHLHARLWCSESHALSETFLLMSLATFERRNVATSLQGSRGRKLLVMTGQVALGVACLVGLFTAVSWTFSQGPEPQGEVRLGRVNDWPEIKNGVPELVSATPAAPTRFAGPPNEARDSAKTGPSAFSGLSQPLDTAFAAPSNSAEPFLSGGQRSNAALTKPQASGNPERSSVSMSGPAAPLGEHKTTSVPVQEEAKLPSVVPAPVAPKLPSDGERIGAETVVERDNAAIQHPPASPRVSDAGGPALRLEDREARPPNSQRQRTNNRTPEQPAARSPGPKVRTSTNETTAERRKERQTGEGRKRTAAVSDGQAKGAGASQTPSNQAESARAEPKDERIRVFGIALPTGRQIKECLLELNC